MSTLPRRPVVYRFQVLLWAVTLVVAVVTTVLFVTDDHRQVIAFVVQGISVLAAAAQWRFGEYRVRRLGPPMTTGLTGWTYVGIFAAVIITNTISKNGSFGASIAGIATAVAGVTPWLIFATSQHTPPLDDGTSEPPVTGPNQADVDQPGPADRPRP